MTVSPKTDTGVDEYREDWRSVARYTVRYQGLYFESQSHVKRSLANGLTYDEACDLKCKERKFMVDQGIKGHVLLDLERPAETNIEYKKVRAARAACENSMSSHPTEAMAA